MGEIKKINSVIFKEETQRSDMVTEKRRRAISNSNQCQSKRNYDEHYNSL